MAVWPPETLHPHIIARSFTKKQISVRCEKALCFSGCDSRPPGKQARSSRKESERSVEVTTLPKPLVQRVLQGLAKGAGRNTHKRH